MTMMTNHFDGRPDIFGNNPDSAMYSVPPHDDDYFEARRHPHFNEEVYWIEREAEFWREMAESFWYSWYHEDLDIMEAVGVRATPYFDEDEDDEEDV